MEPVGPEVSRQTGSAAETTALGLALGRLLQEGDFIGLSGGMGAGKTAFSRGVAEGTGAPAEDVSSPTYAVIQSYPGRVVLHHADLYRLGSVDELFATGFHDLEPGAALVEWIDRAPGALPADALLIRFEVGDGDRRRLRASARGARHVALLEAWLG